MLAPKVPDEDQNPIVAGMVYYPTGALADGV